MAESTSRAVPAPSFSFRSAPAVANAVPAPSFSFGSAPAVANAVPAIVFGGAPAEAERRIRRSVAAAANDEDRHIASLENQLRDAKKREKAEKTRYKKSLIKKLRGRHV